MTTDLHPLGRWLHLGSGFAAVALGLAVMLLPKFGRWAGWHRWVGRVYAALIAAACLLGVPLAYLRGSTYLMILGTLTCAVVVWGWRDGIVARSAAKLGDRVRATRHLRWHLILMGSSYVGAWSGFFATNQVLGFGEWQIWVYVFGPPVVGAVFIARAAVRLRFPQQTPDPAEIGSREG